MGQAAIGLRVSCQDCAADQRVSVSGNAAEHHAAYCCPGQQSCAQDPPRPHRPRNGNLISKRQEKQPAGQPELSLPGTLQIILVSTS